MSKTSSTKPFLLVGELAVAVGVKEFHVRELVRLGRIPHRRAGRLFIFDGEDLPAIRRACTDAGYIRPEVAARA